MYKKFFITAVIIVLFAALGHFFLVFKPLNYINCTKSGGEYKEFPVPDGFPKSYNCVYSYSDGGKKCYSNDDCQGKCLITEDTILKESRNRLLLGPKEIVGGFGRCQHQSNNSPCYPGGFENTIGWCI